MTRKLTDEQVKAIDSLFEDDKGKLNYYVFCGNVNKQIDVRVYASQERTKYLVSAGTDSYKPILISEFTTPDEAIAYTEHLLNQRYCWLPQNNSWFMSGVAYNFANNGANKVLELVHLAHASDWCEWKDVWYTREGRRLGIGMPTSEEWDKGITILANSPILDAVKGVE